MNIINSASTHHPDFQLYQYFSDCLKNFKQKILLLSQLCQLDPETLHIELESTLHSITSQAAKLFNKFVDLYQSNTHMQFIFSRFILRVHEALHTITNKISNTELIGFFQFISSTIREFNYPANIERLMKILLITLPKYHYKTKNTLPQSPQKLSKYHIINPIHKKNEIPLVHELKNQKYRVSYDRSLCTLEKQYKILNCLYFQPSQFRKIFFIALQDLQRHSNNLFEQMVKKNKNIKSSILYYSKQFYKYKKKLIFNKLFTSSLSQQLKSLEIINNKQTTTKNSSIHHKNYQSPKKLIPLNRSIQKQQPNNNPTTLFSSKSLPKINNKKQDFQSKIKVPENQQSSSPPSPQVIKHKAVSLALPQHADRIMKIFPIFPTKPKQLSQNQLKFFPQSFNKKIAIINQQQLISNSYNKRYSYNKIPIINQLKKYKNQSLYQSKIYPFLNLQVNHIKISIS